MRSMQISLALKVLKILCLNLDVHSLHKGILEQIPRAHWLLKGDVGMIEELLFEWNLLEMSLPYLSY